MDFEIFIQACFLGVRLLNLLKPLRFVEQNGRQGYNRKQEHRKRGNIRSVIYPHRIAFSGGGWCSEEEAKTKSDKKFRERGEGNPTTLTVSSLVSEFWQRS